MQSVMVTFSTRLFHTGKAATGGSGGKCEGLFLALQGSGVAVEFLDAAHPGRWNCGSREV